MSEILVAQGDMDIAEKVMDDYSHEEKESY